MVAPIEYKLNHDPLTELDHSSSPTAATVALLRSEVYSNCQQAKWDGHNLGHVGMIMPAADYTALIATQPVPAAGPVADPFCHAPLS